ncbi:unnamed protein product [Hyaloperonospora brassicae]|uniref:Uncharacterized protein n=1 Tax=Hyaloperonospora brassicae TaxID=162125 RepID=A0AAV0SXR5_HYABA|nr:unnamed protein product [Hyaloperonospora brassicae]
MTHRWSILQELLILCLLASPSAVLRPTEAIPTAIAAPSASSECCGTCIGKSSNAVYSYDPVVFDQCTGVDNGVCCFECGNLGDPMYGDTVSYATDGVTAVVPVGSYISFTWSGVENVTYVSLKTGQKKTVTPTVSDAQATVKSDTFLICARSAGTIYFRGWGSDTCREASPEHSITVEASGEKDSGATCDAKDVQVTAPSSASDSSSGSGSETGDATVTSCNVQRASWQTVHGVRKCVCVSDWTNPPECDRWPLWKWLVTIGGAVATLFSIGISVRAYVQSRKRKHEKEGEKLQDDSVRTNYGDAYQENLAPMGTKSDLNPMDYRLQSEYHNAAAMAPSKDVERTPGGTRKPDERLFSL